MKNLTILEKESLEILRQLERCCQVSNPEYVKKEKCVYVMYTDLKLEGLENPQRTQEVVSYLQQNGVDFVITFDLINDIPEMYIDNEHPSYEYIVLGRINGENIEKIKLSVQSLIQKLSTDKKKKQKIWLDKNGINSNSGVIFSFKIITGGQNLPRTKMLKFLSKQKGNIPTRKLLEKSGFSRSSALKRCAAEINTTFISNLGEELILHDKINGTFEINREHFCFVVK